MRQLSLLTALLLFAGAGFFILDRTSTFQSEAPESFSSSINYVLGDESFVETHGAIDREADEVTRIRTHLAYIESLLREKETDHLSAEQKTARKAHLDELIAYTEAGVFPQNTERPHERTPIFIDTQDRLCAVGHLIAKSAGMEAAEQINEHFKFELIQDISSSYLEDWTKKAGFTLRELAKIQPMYCGMDGGNRGFGCIGPDESEKKLNPTAEAAGMAANASFAIANGVLLASDTDSRIAAGIGVISSGAGLGMGLSGRANYAEGDIALAAASLIFSGWHLLDSFNIQPFTIGNSTSLETDGTSRSSRTDLHVEPAMVPSGENEMNVGVRVGLRF